MAATAPVRALLFAALAFLAGCQAPVAPVAAPRTPAGPPRDAFVVLSGGGTPASNNYSQFVQAEAVAAFLRERFPADAVWTFFGAGNRTGEPPLLADVYRQINDDGLLLDTWLPGALPHNRAATKENVLRALRSEILPRVRDGGTLYLFVGDHGELTSGKNPESAITLWGLRPDAARPDGWSPIRDATLSVPELRAALASGLGAGRVVFVMTQCHSGGFHELGVPVDVQPPRNWFVTAPAWLESEGRPLPAAAGFTATDEESIAAGCDPAPDPETWLGYERFLPEKLLGHTLLAPTAPRGEPAASFADAHRAAVLADPTIDKPRASSEHYLERWAALIEERLARELVLAPPVRAAVESYRRAVDRGRFDPLPADAAFNEAVARYDDLLDAMSAQNPTAARLLRAGTRAELERPRAPRAARPMREAARDDTPAGNLSRTQSQAWRDVLRPAWHRAVAAGEVPEIPAAALAFEKSLHPLDARRPAGFADDWSGRALNELYWKSTYAVPARFDAATAAAVSRWAATRRVAILAWAERSADPALREAAARFGREYRRSRTAPAHVATPPELPLATAAARALFYRRTLAAWAFLLAVDHRPALDRLAALRALESTPLPPASP